MKRYVFKLKDRLRRGYFSRRVQGLLHTAPLELGDATAPVVLSQLQHKDVLMYLAAVKSFARKGATQYRACVE